MKNEDEPVEIIALGPLTNIMDAHKSFPKLTDEINDTIAWYNPGIKPETGIYYNDDPAAFQYLIQQGDLFFKAIHNKESKDYAIDDNFLQKTKNIDSPYAQLIAESHYDSLIYRKIKISHLKLWDDMIVAYILNPNLFNTKTNKSHPNLMNIIPMKDARNDIIQLLYDALSNPNTSLIFEHFPTDKSYFQDDVKSVLEQIIQQHGKTEWGICVLTNEFHGHLGVYSLIGAKMGLRAREYYNIGKDDFYISSFAGTHPPVSCMNDGLQLSTGATLGHGLIKANDTDNPIPSATFKFKNNVIKLTLKKKYHERVKKIIKTCSKEENYWPVLRKYALQLWLDFDRHEMFIIEEVNNNKLANHE